MVLGTLIIISEATSLPSVHLQSCMPTTSRVTENRRTMSPYVDFRSTSLLSVGFVFWIWVLLRSRSFSTPPLCLSTAPPHFPCGERKISPTSLSRLTRHSRLLFSNTSTQPWGEPTNHACAKSSPSKSKGVHWHRCADKVSQ